MTAPRAAVNFETPPVGPSDAAVYVHFPYCGVKCPYCDFNSHVLPHDDVRYADAVLRELDARSEDLSAPWVGLSSLYFGGGTPSRWAPEQVGRVVAAVANRYRLAEGAEVTLEVNPGTATEARFEAYRSVGINRFSIGCQSFDDAELAGLGRAHGAEAGRRAVRLARKTGARVSLDLIYGLPGQTERDALRSLDEALELEPDHISAYTLTIEPGTVLDRRVRLKTFVPMPDDDQAALIERVGAHLASAGYERYEVSSYARAGRVSVHNTLYWLGGAYLGLGAGAHGYHPLGGLLGATRRENERAPERYIAGALGDGVAARFLERLDRRQTVADRLMIGFRTAFGVDPEQLANEVGPSLDGGALRDELGGWVGRGLLERRGTRFAPTAQGFLFNDGLARAMIELVPLILGPD